MQKLFTFVPSTTKPDVQFFKSEDCTIIQGHDPRGYFVITDEEFKPGQKRGYMPQKYCAMWWTIAIPTSTRIAHKIRCFKQVQPLRIGA